jgi:hypothetical protein
VPLSSVIVASPSLYSTWPTASRTGGISPATSNRTPSTRNDNSLSPLSFSSEPATRRRSGSAIRNSPSLTLPPARFASTHRRAARATEPGQNCFTPARAKSLIDRAKIALGTVAAKSSVPAPSAYPAAERISIRLNSVRPARGASTPWARAAKSTAGSGESSGLLMPSFSTSSNW